MLSAGAFLSSKPASLGRYGHAYMKPIIPNGVKSFFCIQDCAMDFT